MSEKTQFKVSSKSQTRRVALALAKSTADMDILAAGVEALNITIKAIANSRDQLEGRDAGFEIRFGAETEKKGPRRLDIKYINFSSKVETGDEVIYNVKKETKSAGLAGMLVARLKENATKTHTLSCVGAASVSRGLVALALLNEYVPDQKFYVVPYFTKAQKGGTEFTTLNLAIMKA
jgi:stage V sporulation protein SpoVS